MELKRLASLLGITEVPEAFCKFCEQGGTPAPLCDLEKIDELEARYATLGEYHHVIREVAQAVAKDENGKAKPF